MTLPVASLFVSAVLVMMVGPEGSYCYLSYPPSCATVRCPLGTVCRMQQVRCYGTHCNPVPYCFRVYTQVATKRLSCTAVIQPPSCANVRCPSRGVQNAKGGVLHLAMLPSTHLPERA
ncbi:uncharacterized protein LOC110837991 [Zootermopsis nevadensis]|uniref:uncharacterized protein LOC110837991 n=1 Tax=Zootermopsis nevadensis TaxID=136037 RepID=UPI000B8E4F90|nr:uncharacterized protein LOC110837991 [Zootermopsis nevadensis]